MTKKNVSMLLLAIATVAVCLALIITGTYALFSDAVLVKNHLSAGTLSIELARTKLTGQNINDQGVMEPIFNDERKTFTKTDENVFGLDGTVPIAPKSYFEAEMEIVNKGSVAFNYWISIKLSEEKASGAVLPAQLKATVTVDGKESTTFLSEALFIGSEKEPIGWIAANATGTFTVKVEFVDLEGKENNAAANQNAYFDLLVNAIQYTGTGD